MHHRLFVMAAALMLGSAASAQQPKAALSSSMPRTLKFTTDQGTWISLDVSRDGNTIVFELLGDLYTLPITGGDATRITSGPAFDSQPRYSPDGKQILFVSDRDGSDQLWIMSADGSSAHAVTRGTGHWFISPEWSPDGAYIVTSRRDGPAGSGPLYQYKIGTDSITKLTDNAVGAAFGPDGRYVWGTTVRPPDGQSWLGAYQLIVYDRFAGKSSTRSFARGGAMRPALSPDGNLLVYATETDTATAFVVRDLRTNAERVLFATTSRIDAGEADDTRDALPGYSFTPDSKALVLTLDGKLYRVDVTTGAKTLIPFRAEVDQQLRPLVRFQRRVNDSRDVALDHLTDIRFSPDGKRVAFGALNQIWVVDWPNARRSTVANVDTIRGARPLTDFHGAAFQPAWSPDGKYVAFAARTANDSGVVYRIRADGRGKPERLTSGEWLFSHPVYSPDGSRIVTVRGWEQDGRSVRTEVAWYPSAGVDQPGTLITNDVNEDAQPAFTARDTARIYLGTTSVKWDGSGRTEYYKPAYDQRVYWSPDGKYAAVTQPWRVRMAANRYMSSKFSEVYLLNAPAPDSGTAKEIVVPGPAARSATRSTGEFPGWTADGRTIHYSLGNAVFLVDVTADTLKAREYVIDVRVPRDRPNGALLLRGARVVTMKGNEIIDKGDILVVDNRIAGVGPTGTISAPTGAKIIDVSGKFIMPGMFDIHAHPRLEDAATDPWPWQPAMMLAYGITTFHDPQSQTTDIFGVSELAAAGTILSSRIMTTGPSIEFGDELRSLDDARRVVGRYANYLHTNTIKEYTVGGRQQRQWVNEAAAELGVHATTEGSRDVKMAITDMLDGYSGHEHNFPIPELYEDMLRLIAFAGTIYTPTLLVNYGAPAAQTYYGARYDEHDDPKARRFYPHDYLDLWTLRNRRAIRENQFRFRAYATQLAEIVAHGGRVGLGGHGVMIGPGVHWELWAMQSGGLSTLETLRAATANGAEALGVSQDLGSIEVGKLADILVLDRDPLVDIHNSMSIRYVIKNGRLYDAENLDEICPRQVTSRWHVDRSSLPSHQ